MKINKKDKKKVERVFYFILLSAIFPLFISFVGTTLGFTIKELGLILLACVLFLIYNDWIRIKFLGFKIEKGEGK
jgi:hypothetical protein